MDKEDVVHIYNAYILLFVNLPFAPTWTYLEGIMQNGMSHRERQILYDITYMWNLKTVRNE